MMYDILVWFYRSARSGELSGQLKTIRSQAESAKQELVDYKDKATRILQVGKCSSNRLN